jgi:hypothetical protein
MNAETVALKPDKKSKHDRGATGRETKFDELTANAAPVEQWQSARPPLPQCTQQVFLNDLINFLTVRAARLLLTCSSHLLCPACATESASVILMPKD